MTARLPETYQWLLVPEQANPQAPIVFVSVLLHELAHAAAIALFRKLALALLKQHPRKDSIARKRKAAAWDSDFLAQTLAGAPKLDNV